MNKREKNKLNRNLFTVLLVATFVLFAFAFSGCKNGTELNNNGLCKTTN